ncbi:MAG: hypothetical protein HZA54_04960 [Planctomycetes bacterium]|nr:hypothetical protein [Planctomycetota bacterium]
MDAREKEIAFLEAEILDCEKKCASGMAEIGRAVVGLAPTGATHDDLARNLEKVRAVDTRATKDREDVDRIKNRVDRVAQIQNSLRENERKIADAQRDVESRHGDIGAVAYEVYRTKCAKKDAYRDVFAELLAIDEEKQKIEAEIKELDSAAANRGFFAGISDKAKSLAKKTALSMKEMGRKTAAVAAGRKVCDSDFDKQVGDEALTRMLAVVVNNRKLAGTLGEESTALRAEQTKLEEDLRGLGAAEGYEKRVRELEADAQQAQAELAALAAAVGSVVHEQKLDATLGSDQVTALCKGVSDLKRQVGDKKAQIERWKAQIEMERVATEMDGLKAKRAEREERIRALTGEIAEVDKELATLAQKHEGLRKVAGVEAAPAGGAGAGGGGGAPAA